MLPSSGCLFHSYSIREEQRSYKLVGTKGRPKSRKSSEIHAALDRIKDLKVTKKSFKKWMPLSKVTIVFVEDILESVIL